MATNSVTLSAGTTSWVVPNGITLLDKVEVWAGGGSGGATTSATTGTGGGAGGGSYSSNNNIAVTPGQNITVAIGQGGAAVNGNTNGANGNNSSFNNGAILAIFGQRGLRTNAAGVGGATASAVGEVKYAGGAGAAGTNASGIGGGGGAGGSNNNTGNAASGINRGVGQAGGGSGGNGGAANSNGNDAEIPGGGGGGSGNNGSGGPRYSGKGGNGQIIITWTEKTLSGITRDSTGNPLVSCDVYCFKDNGNNTATFVGNTTSNSSTGAYSFLVSGEGNNYFVVAFKDGSPNLSDITTRDLAPT
jgi:hypothetical protein